MVTNNLFSPLPQDLSSEVFETLAQGSNVRIERIVSMGHSTADNQWYDQDDHEWVILVQGGATIQFADSPTLTHLSPGDYINIPAHTKHRVESTDDNNITVWLAVHYQ
ncbi:MAG: cupin domain-containing protein [Pseudomonadales bacterium]|nr:cupin domain-containing protein [Pseudomonadales bacterium]